MSRIAGTLRKDFLMATVITTMMVLAGLYLPLFGLFVSVFIPIPVLFFRLKRGRYGGAVVLITVTVIVAAILRWQSIALTVFFFELGLVGFVLSEMFEMNLSLEKTVAATTGVVVVSVIATLALYSFLSTESIGALLAGYIETNIQRALEVYQALEVPQEQIDLVAESMEGILFVILRIMPAIVIASTLFIVWSNLLVARPLLQNARLGCPDFGVLREWKAPEQLVWVAIVSGILLLVPSKGFNLLGVNGLIIMTMIYFFQGIAIVSFYFEKKKFPKILRGILYGLIVLQQFVLVLVVAAGFFDLWADFRRLKKGDVKINESDTERKD